MVTHHQWRVVIVTHNGKKPLYVKILLGEINGKVVITVLNTELAGELMLKNRTMTRNEAIAIGRSLVS